MLNAPYHSTLRGVRIVMKTHVDKPLILAASEFVLSNDVN